MIIKNAMLFGLSSGLILLGCAMCVGVCGSVCLNLCVNAWLGHNVQKYVSKNSVQLTLNVQAI